MGINYSTFIFLASFSFLFGYASYKDRRFVFSRIFLFGISTYIFISYFGQNKAHIMTLLTGYFSGALYQFFDLLRDFLERTRENIRNFINRLQSINLDTIFRKAKNQAKSEYREYTGQKRQNESDYQKEKSRRESESRQYRQQQKKSKQQSKSENNQYRQKQSDYQEDRNNSGNSNSNSSSQKQQSTNSPTRQNHLQILGLAPDRQYSNREIKTAYRRMANKFHPDKHPKASEAEKKKMAEKFRNIKEAYDDLLNKN